MTLRWGVLGARSRIHRQRLRPAFGLSGERIVAEASRRGDDMASYDEVVADPNVDAVYVPLPNSLHAPWVTKALECGKHVLCEKPLTLDAEETAALYATAAACGQHLSEAYVWPHHPRAQKLLEIVAAGELGDVFAHHGVFQYLVGRDDDHRLDERGGGALFDVGIYCLGPALMMNPPAGAGRLAATGRRNDAGVDVAMTGWVEFAPGRSATFAVSCDAPPRRSQEVVGPDGMVLIDAHVPGPDRPGTLVINRRDGGRDDIPFAGANAYERMITAFVAESRGEVEPRWPAAASLRLANLLAALHRSSIPASAG
ncbi:MAG: Gfo/Idh/MocA family oxidoreductase [Actinomycetota bacterium]|nr:Gfo/Idh/MocA family oxidoreductase [Actinomycetota bacterium]